jgi:enoyl-CoA hydratase
MASGELEEAIILEKAGPVATITINRPKHRNSIDLAAAQRISECVQEIENDKAIHVGIITGSGNIAFTAGLDLQARARGEPRPIIPLHGFGGFARYKRTKPFIAAVNGFAIGGGFEIAMACELIVAAPGAYFAIPETLRGLIAGGNILPSAFGRLPRAIAWEVALTGRQITAREALDRGMINKVDPDVMAAAHALAMAVLAGAPLAIQGTLRLVGELLPTPSPRYDELTEETQRHLFTTDDAKEGVNAFVEKRKAVWTGR